MFWHVISDGCNKIVNTKLSIFFCRLAVVLLLLLHTLLETTTESLYMILNLGICYGNTLSSA